MAGDIREIEDNCNTMTEDWDYASQQNRFDTGTTQALPQ